MIDIEDEDAPLAPGVDDEGMDEDAPLAPEANNEGAAVDEEDVPPLAVEDEEETGIVDIEDETTPLASAGVIEGAGHCIFHFLELILAGGTAAYGVGSTRKDKKKIDDLKKGKRG